MFNTLLSSQVIFNLIGWNQSDLWITHIIIVVMAIFENVLFLFHQLFEPVLHQLALWLAQFGQRLLLAANRLRLRVDLDRLLGREDGLRGRFERKAGGYLVAERTLRYLLEGMVDAEGRIEVSPLVRLCWRALLVKKVLWLWECLGSLLIFALAVHAARPRRLKRPRGSRLDDDRFIFRQANYLLLFCCLRFIYHWFWRAYNAVLILVILLRL